MIDFLQKNIFALLRMDDQQKGTDFPEKHKTAYLFLIRHFGSRSTRSGSFIFKMAAMLQIQRVFPLVSSLGSAKAVQCPRPEPKIGDKSQQIPRYSHVCSRGQPPRMAADKYLIRLCILIAILNTELFRSLSFVFEERNIYMY